MTGRPSDANQGGAAAGISVALLNPYYWPEVRRGSERVIRDLSGGLAARGQKPVVIAGTGGRSRRTIEDGVVIRRNRRLPEGPARRLGYGEPLGHTPGAYRALRAEAPDLAHAFYSTDALAALAWARRRPAPLVFSVMGIPHEAAVRARRGRLWAWRRIVAGADAVVVLSEAARAAFAWLCPDPAVIEPGVDLGAFTRTAERAPEPTILCPAAIGESRKRVPLLLEAFAAVRRRLPSARLVLSRPAEGSSAGIGLDRPGVELRDLDRHVDLVRAYSEAWVTALPSRDEAFGLVLAESLACGTPVVGTDEAGIPEVVGSGAVGRLFAADDPAALERALREALELAAAEEIELACRARAERFSVERGIDRHLELYERLTRGVDPARP